MEGEQSNANRQNKVFEVGEKVLIKSPLYIEEKVDADLGATVLI